MTDKREFLVQVDEYGNWTEGKYRKVNAEELDEILKKYGDRVLSICSSRSRGAMTMWACFKSRINSGCYSDMINAYTLLSDDPKSLHEREHELRHAWDEYEELWAIRYHGTLEQYYLDEAKKAREHAERYQQTEPLRPRLHAPAATSTKSRSSRAIASKKYAERKTSPPARRSRSRCSATAARSESTATKAPQRGTARRS